MPSLQKTIAVKWEILSSMRQENFEVEFLRLSTSFAWLLFRTEGIKFYTKPYEALPSETFLNRIPMIKRCHSRTPVWIQNIRIGARFLFAVVYKSLSHTIKYRLYSDFKTIAVEPFLFYLSLPSANQGLVKGRFESGGGVRFLNTLL